MANGTLHFIKHTMQFKSKYTEEQKREAVNRWAILGSTTKVLKGLTYTLPRQTFLSWRKTEWWHDMISEVRVFHKEAVDGKFSGLIDKLIDTIDDRIANGDQVVDPKTGRKSFKKVSLKDATTTLKEVIEKRALFRGEPTSHRKTTSVEKKLHDIQERLEDYAAKSKTLSEKEKDGSVEEHLH